MGLGRGLDDLFCLLPLLNTLEDGYTHTRIYLHMHVWHMNCTRHLLTALIRRRLVMEPFTMYHNNRPEL